MKNDVIRSGLVGCLAVALLLYGVVTVTGVVTVLQTDSVASPPPSPQTQTAAPGSHAPTSVPSQRAGQTPRPTKRPIVPSLPAVPTVKPTVKPPVVPSLPPLPSLPLPSLGL